MADQEIDRKPAPYVEIIEQPTSKGIRFRYECEGRFAGSLEGEKSSHFVKTYPTIKIMNYKGPAFIVVSCVAKEPPYYPHPHNLVGKAKEVSRGICFFKTETEDMTVSFQNLGIQCVRRKDIQRSLEVRQSLQVDPFNTGYGHVNNSDDIDLYCVRLCFQVFLEGSQKDNFNVPLEPIVSEQIHDRKFKAEPVINFISHQAVSVAGDTQICVLCEKVSRDDIEVLFSNQEHNWEAVGKFATPCVYKQAAIVVKAPQYIDQNINHPVDVKVQLRRPSDGEVSDHISIKYLPLEAHKRIGFKRKRTSDFSLVMKLQAEVSKKPELLGLACQSKQLADNIEPWEASLKAPNSFIPVVTLRKNEFSAVRQQSMMPTAAPQNYAIPPKIEPTTAYQHLNVETKSENVVTKSENVEIKQYKNSSDTLNSDGWINDLMDIITSPILSDSKNNNIAPEPETHFIPVDQYAPNHFVPTDDLLGLDKPMQPAVPPISGNLSDINISDLIRDIVN